MDLFPSALFSNFEMEHHTVLTLPDSLRNTAERFPGHGVGFINAGGETLFYTFPELQSRALAVLNALQERGLRPGDRVILSLETGAEIIPVLWGCLLGGFVPALLQPPVTFTTFNPAAEKTRKVFRILRDPYVIVSHLHAVDWASENIPSHLLIDAKSLGGDARLAKMHEAQPADLALIQFSSGSTGDPKGVMLTHRNILTNIRDIVKGIRLEPSDMSVNWMPLYHDMGLVGFHLTPVLVGVNQYFIDPPDFVKNPSLWLEAMTKHRCTITACPNFGQTIVNRYLARRSTLTWDLSPVRILFNGAEPISVTTMTTFLENLKPFNLDPDAMFPAYGLAEATLAVTFPEPGTITGILDFQRQPLVSEGLAVEADTGSRDVMTLVNLGKPLDNTRVRIINRSGHEVPAGVVGEVLVCGQNVTSGYFGSTEGSRGLFRDQWLLTGDLGFMFRGDLFITGRSKDIIFINGMNHYAHDLETVALAIDGLTAGKFVITGSFDEGLGRDQILFFIVGTANEQMSLLCKRIRNHFSTVMGISTDLFIPVRSADIPRTSSGKIQRYLLTARYLLGDFPQVIRL
jgi:acyl-CoA synthetase (AMP-forming)/AMP-acid ligase II